METSSQQQQLSWNQQQQQMETSSQQQQLSWNQQQQQMETSSQQQQFFGQRQQQQMETSLLSSHQKQQQQQRETSSQEQQLSWNQQQQRTEAGSAADGDFFTFFTPEAEAADGDFFTGAAAFLEPTAAEDGDVSTRTTAGAFLAAAAQDCEFFRGVLATTA
jgi:hypothetical protein